MYKLKMKHHFDAAHYLQNYEGKCHNLHGHRWEVVVKIGVEKLDEQGFVVDFGLIKEIINQYDHACLNDFGEYKTIQPTAENIACLIYQKIKKLTPRIKHLIVTIFEAPDNSITYYESK